MSDVQQAGIPNYWPHRNSLISLDCQAPAGVKNHCTRVNGLSGTTKLAQRPCNLRRVVTGNANVLTVSQSNDMAFRWCAYWGNCRSAKIGDDMHIQVNLKSPISER
jgi:hypothetical protein